MRQIRQNVRPHEANSPEFGYISYITPGLIGVSYAPMKTKLTIHGLCPSCEVQALRSDRQVGVAMTGNGELGFDSGEGA